MNTLMDNYAKMLQEAKLRFLTYDRESLLQNPGVAPWERGVQTVFLGSAVFCDCSTGAITTHEGKECDFSQVLSVLDYICDRKTSVKEQGEFCPVGSLPGVFVGGSGLSMGFETLAERVQNAPDAFQKACHLLGAEEIPLGDMGYKLHIFPDICMELKFYFADEDFPPQLTFLWDKNILQFVRYETVYYIAGCIARELCSRMDN